MATSSRPTCCSAGRGGVLKVSDFGIARVVRSVQPRERDAAGASEGVAHLVGAVIGTPEYMAPEQLIGGHTSPASDIYAAGIVLHECLSGTTPFDAETRVTFLAHKMDTPARPVPTVAVTRSDMRGSLEDVIARMMAPAPEDRPASASDLLAAFARID